MTSIYDVNTKLIFMIFTPPRNHGGVIFSQQFVTVCVCVCVCACVCVSVCLSVNKSPAERMHQFEHGFCYMAAYRTGLDCIEVGDL